MGIVPDPRIDISWYKSIFENAQEAITITDLSGNILMTNKPALDMFEYSFEELEKINAKEVYANLEDRGAMLLRL